jgi:hypothetical protein
VKCAVDADEHSYHMTFFEDEPIPYPPGLPIPGNTKRAVDLVTQMSWPEHPLPPYMGQTFPTMCKFWVLIQGIMAVYRTNATGPSRKTIPLAFAESKYQELLSWADTLKEGMSRGRLGHGHEFIFQYVSVPWLHIFQDSHNDSTLYHVAILDIFRPFVQKGERRRLKSFASADSSSHAIYHASLRQLKRILLEYLTRFDATFYSAWLSTAALRICNAVLKDPSSPEWKFYFWICVGFWKKTVARFPIQKELAQANLALAMSAGCLGGKQADAVMEEFRRLSSHHGSEQLATSLILDVERVNAAGTGSRTSDIANNFEELAAFDMFTTGEYES